MPGLTTTPMTTTRRPPVLETLLSAFRTVASGLSGSGLEQAAAEDVKALESFLGEREQAAAAAAGEAERKAVAWLTSRLHQQAPPAA